MRRLEYVRQHQGIGDVRAILAEAISRLRGQELVVLSNLQSEENQAGNDADVCANRNQLPDVECHL